MALSATQTIAGPQQDQNSRVQPMDPCTNLQTTLVLRPATEQERPDSATEKEYEPNHWQPIISKYARNLDHLPVPPKNFIQNIWKAQRIKDKEKRDRLKVNFRVLQEANKKGQQRTIPSRRKNECMRWVLQPTTEKPPEPKPGVPTITVTDPAGKNWWPKDPNSYVTAEEEVRISERMTEQHDGPDSMAHRAAFEKAYRKGWDHKPIGMRPEVLHCCACWNEQELFGDFIEEKPQDNFVF